MMIMKNRKRFIALLSFALIAVLLFAGCKPDSGSVFTPTPGNASSDDSGKDAYPSPGDKSVDGDQIGSGEGDTSDSEVYPGPEEVAAQPEAAPAETGGDDKALPTSPPDFPEPKTGMEATDPEIVSIASGEIQLVEFFAFW
jgi:hypothetical protein